MYCKKTARPMLGLALAALGCLAGCSAATGSPNKTDDQYKQDIVAGMHDSLLTEIEALHAAAVDLQAAAPTPQGRGWDDMLDRDAIDATKAAWIRARTAYEHIEGALAPLFPDIDSSIDARYDDFLTELVGKGDDNPFDGEGVTGLHAAERILWADSVPQRVVDFEQALPGYKPAAFPASAQEAADFKQKLCAKIVEDAATLRDQWTPQRIDLAGAFQGLISLMNEQQEKVNKASSNEEESRYSQRTMADIRDNLEGTIPIYELFDPWLGTKSNPKEPAQDGKQTGEKIRSGFGELSSVYDAVKGDAIPEPPATWSAENPSAADLQTPFGKLYSSVKGAVDPTLGGSIVHEMNTAATILGFPQFREE
jgi:iron uptake system component EfeO